jgi:hypothetical protein
MALILTALSFLPGCAPPAQKYDLLPARPDDVSLSARNLKYDPSVSGYTFSYDERRPDNPCQATKWCYVRKDALVAMRASALSCAGQGGDVTEVWLRADWNQPDEPAKPQDGRKIPATFPATNPGR